MSVEIMLTCERKKFYSSMSYEEFVIWLQQNQGIVTQESYNTPPSSRYPNGGYVSCRPSSSGNMWGSPYKTFFSSDSPFGLITTHGIPIDCFDDISGNQRYCAMHLSGYGSYEDYLSVTRNGYTSKPWGTQYGPMMGFVIDDFIFYDYIKGNMMRYNPLLDNDRHTFDGSLIV